MKHACSEEPDVPHAAVRSFSAVMQQSHTRRWRINAADWVFTSSPVDLELNRDFNGDDYEYEDEAKLVIFPDHFEIPLPNIEELPALVRELLHGSVFLSLGVFLSLHADGRGALSGSSGRLLHLV